MIDISDENFVRKNLSKGVRTDFWKIITAIIEENIKHLDSIHLKQMKDFEQLTGEECKMEIAIYNTKREYLVKLKELPKTTIDKMSGRVAEVENFDPYRKSEDFLPKNTD
jgi:hypothetical protein